MGNALQIIEKKVTPFEKKILSLKINDDKKLVEGTDLLSQVNKYIDRATEEKEKITKPLNQALKVERARWKPLEDKLEALLLHLKKQMSTYQTKKDEEFKQQQKEIADKVATGEISIEKAVAQMDNKVETKVFSNNGSINFITVKNFEVMDITLLPKDFILPDEVKIRLAMKNGIEIPGVRYFEEKQIRNKR